MAGTADPTTTDVNRTSPPILTTTDQGPGPQSGPPKHRRSVYDRPRHSGSLFAKAPNKRRLHPANSSPLLHPSHLSSSRAQLTELQIQVPEPLHEGPGPPPHHPPLEHARDLERFLGCAQRLFEPPPSGQRAAQPRRAKVADSRTPPRSTDPPAAGCSALLAAPRESPRRGVLPTQRRCQRQRSQTRFTGPRTFSFPEPQ